MMKNGLSKKKEYPAHTGGAVYPPKLNSKPLSGNVKSAGKIGNIPTQSTSKEVPKKPLLENGNKKPGNKIMNNPKNSPIDGAFHISNQHSSGPKITYGSNPAINVNFLPDSNKNEIRKETFSSSKLVANKNLNFGCENNLNNLSPSNPNILNTNGQCKNLNSNTWRKPFGVGSNTSPSTNIGRSNLGKFSKEKANGPPMVSTPTNINTCAFSTINTDNNKDKEKPTSTTISTEFQFVEAIKPKYSLNNIQTDILSSINNLKCLFKQNESKSQIEKMLKSEDNMNKINELNIKLGICNGQNIKIQNYPNKDKHYTSNANLIHTTLITREEFPFLKLCEIPEAEDTIIALSLAQSKEDEIPNEVLTPSEIRIKRYEILFEFLNKNLQEINQMVTSKKSSRLELNKIDEISSKSNRFSSLHSKIDFTKTNALHEKESNYDYQDNEMQEKSNTIVPYGNLKDTKDDYDIEFEPNEINPQPFFKEVFAPSVLISSIHSEFYQILLNDSNTLRSSLHLNISENKKFISFGTDSTPLQYLQRNRMDDNRLFTKNQVHHSKMNSEDVNINRRELILWRGATKRIPQEVSYYNEGEENIEDSESDKTKVQIQILDLKKIACIQSNQDSKKELLESKPKHLPEETKTDVKPKETNCTLY